MANLDEVEITHLTPSVRIVRKVKQRPRKALPAGRVSFAKQLDILRAAAVASGIDRKPVSNEEVAHIVDLYFGTVSNCNPFFIDSGLFTRNKLQTVPCEEVFAYADRYEWDQEKAAFKLGPVIRKTWFTSALLPKLSFRPLPADEAISILASEAGASPEYKDQLNMLIEFMRVSGIVNVENNMISLNKANLDEEHTSSTPTSSEDVVSVSAAQVPQKKNSSEELEQHPFISGLLKTLPQPGEEWSLSGRIKWLQAASNIFGLIYTTTTSEETEDISIERRK